MAIHSGSHAEPHPTTSLDRLVRERGLHRYAFFFVTGEGDYLPNGEEEKSGHVLDDQGRIHSFWTGWDPSLKRVIFSEWEQVDAEPAWHDSDEYRRARAQVGHDPAGSRRA
jgi:hypothetical protein